MSRRATTGRRFAWLGNELLSDLMDYCACYNDTSLTFIVRKSVREFLRSELSNAEIRTNFNAMRRARVGTQNEDKVTPLRPASKR